LGDYVDREKQGIETICLLMAYKVKYPNNVFILRGNHETSTTSRVYGFYDECKRRYSIKLWKNFVDLFNYLSVSAVINDKIFCMHGGLSQDLTEFEGISFLQKPTEIPDIGILCDLLWADPDKEVVTYSHSDRGVSYLFSENVVHEFNKKNKLDLILRAHQVMDSGFGFLRIGNY